MVQKLKLLLLVLFMFSCNQDDKIEEEIGRIPVEVDVLRFDQRFAGATVDSLQALKGDFPYLFPAQYPDSVWVGQMKDTIQQEINVEVAKRFPNLKKTKQELHSLFQHLKYYFPETEIPQVVTLTSLVDYKNKVIWSDNLLLISLDTYLGENHHFYIGIQDYLKKNFDREQIIPDATAAFVETKLSPPDSRIFVDHMVYYGKILYMKDLLIPFKTNAQKMGYSEEELEWAKANEEQIWRYFVDKEILFASDSDLFSRFLYLAPFSKFYLQLDNESPDRLGQFIGWQMVRQFMDNSEVSVKEMLKTDGTTIFKESNYKPRK